MKYTFEPIDPSKYLSLVNKGPDPGGTNEIKYYQFQNGDIILIATTQVGRFLSPVRKSKKQDTDEVIEAWIDQAKENIEINIKRKSEAFKLGPEGAGILQFKIGPIQG